MTQSEALNRALAKSAPRGWMDRDALVSAFGGKGKGGGGGKSTTTQTVQYSPEEEARRQQIFKKGESLYTAQEPTISTYRGPVPVGFDPATLTAQGLAAFQAGQGASWLPAAGATLDASAGRNLNLDPDIRAALQRTLTQPAASAGPASQALNFGLTGAVDVRNNPYLAEAMSAAIRPQVQTFTEQTLPSLRLGSTVGGTLGSSRAGIAEGLAASRLQDAIASTTAQMGSQAYGQGLQAQASSLGAFNQLLDVANRAAALPGDQALAAARALPGVLQAGQVPASMLSQVGAQRENLQQEIANFEAAQRIAAVNQPWDLLNAWAGLLQSMSNPITQTTSNLPRQGISAPQGLGLLGSLVGLGRKIFSPS